MIKAQAFEGRRLEFRLTYSGALLGASKKNTRAKHKHEIRRVFHRQLMHLWQTVPHLKQGSRVSSSSFVTWPDHDERTYQVETIADQHRKWGYRFVPLVTEYLNLLCGLDILFLRPEDPGKLVQGGDIDNRLKTLFDALRMPHEQSELGGYDSPSDGEDPFFCLLRDDSLISNVSVDTDSLLEPVQESKYQANDARLVITVKIRPQQLDIDNIQFA